MPGRLVSRPTTALVVEDDPETRALLQHFLHTRNFLTLGASNGEEALEVVDRAKIDILLTDINMPRMNGIEVVATLRALGFCSPILVLTSDTSPGMQSRVMAAGADQCLWKPVDLSLLGDWLTQSQPEKTI